MSPRPASLLRELENLREQFGGNHAARKLELLRALEPAKLSAAGQVLRLHEMLCFWRAYPENQALLTLVERMLERFDRRPDLGAQRERLADSGIAGTALYFRFYWLMAIRLAERWPQNLSIDWKDFENAAGLGEILHLLLPFSETPALQYDFAPRHWIDRLKAPGETDAAFVIRRFEALRIALPGREHVYEKLDIPIRLAAGADTPARTREKWDGAPIVFVKRRPSRSRPSLRHAAQRTRLRVREVPPGEARALIDLANAAMVPRHRDLLAFLHADEGDVRIVDFGDGLQFACIGAMPDRRMMFEAVYGFLTLRNGVPIGYVLNSALFGSCELAYNVFDTFRGVEAAKVYGCFLATVHRLFAADSFTIDPYQLGHGNREGQLSGAWWFYYKLGFRPRDPEIRALVREELRRIETRRGYRTPPARLNRLAADNMFLSLGRARADVLGRIELDNVGLHLSRYLSRRFGGRRERGIRTCAREVARLLGLRDLRRLQPGERIAWERWSPLVLSLDGVERWSVREKTALAAVVRAKGGRRESDFVRLFDGHAKLRRAILRLARRPAPEI